MAIFVLTSVGICTPSFKGNRVGGVCVVLLLLFQVSRLLWLSLAGKQKKKLWDHNKSPKVTIAHGSSWNCTRILSPKTNKQIPKRREKQRSKSQSVWIHVFGKKSRKPQARAKLRSLGSEIRLVAKLGAGSGPCVRLKSEDLEA